MRINECLLFVGRTTHHLNVRFATNANIKIFGKPQSPVTKPERSGGFGIRRMAWFWVLADDTNAIDFS